MLSVFVGHLQLFGKKSQQVTKKKERTNSKEKSSNKLIFAAAILCLDETYIKSNYLNNQFFFLNKFLSYSLLIS